MRKKTFVGGLVVALAALYPVASNFHGTKLHEQVDKEVNKINQYLSQEFGSKIAVDAKLTQSDLFSSQYILTVKLPDGKEIELLKQEVEHGPFPLSALKRGHVVPVSYASKTTLIRNDYTKAWFDMATSEEPLVAEYSFGYDKKIKGDVLLSPTLYSDDAFNTSTGDLSLHFKTDVDTQESVVDLNFGGITIESSIIDSDLKPYRLRTGQWESHYELTRQGDLVTRKSVSSLSEFSFDEEGVNISYPQITVEETLTDDGKQIDISDNTVYQGFIMNDIDLGQLTSRVSVKKLDSKAVTQLRKIFGKLFVDVMRQIVQEPTNQLSDAQFKQLLEQHKIPLEAALLSLLNQGPELGYEQISLKNKEGEIKAAVQLNFLPVTGSFTTDPMSILLNNLSKVKVDLQLENGAISQLLFDFLSLSAKRNELALPTEGDKQELKSIVSDLVKALVDTQFVKESAPEQQRFSLLLDAKQEGSIQTLQQINWNGEDIQASALMIRLDNQVKRLQEQLSQLSVLDRFMSLVQRFNIDSVDNAVAP